MKSSESHTSPSESHTSPSESHTSPSKSPKSHTSPSKSPKSHTSPSKSPKSHKSHTSPKSHNEHHHRVHVLGKMRRVRVNSDGVETIRVSKRTLDKYIHRHELKNYVGGAEDELNKVLSTCYGDHVQRKFIFKRNYVTDKKYTDTIVVFVTPTQSQSLDFIYVAYIIKNDAISVKYRVNYDEKVKVLKAIKIIDTYDDKGKPHNTLENGNYIGLPSKDGCDALCKCIIDMCKVASENNASISKGEFNFEKWSKTEKKYTVTQNNGFLSKLFKPKYVIS